MLPQPTFLYKNSIDRTPKTFQDQFSNLSAIESIEFINYLINGIFKNNFKKKMYAPERERGGGDYLNLIVNAFAMRLLTRLMIVVDREVDYCLNCSIFILLKH